MSTAAYILIDVEAGKALKALEGINKIKEVKRAHLITGVHDIVAYVESEDINTLGDIVLGQIHKIDGVTKTAMCVARQE